MKYLICNLKSNMTYAEMLLYREEILNIRSNIKVILAPTDIYLNLFKGTNIYLCTQNIDLPQDLIITGNTNIKQLKSVGVEYALIGHFERRFFYQENEYDIIKKVNAAIDNDLKVIYCVGESLEELMRKVEYQVLERSIAKILNSVDRKKLNNIIIAYEPAYLIGKEARYDLKHIEECISFIKRLVFDYYQVNIEVVFGGNINKNNVNYFLNMKNLDGFIIGNSAKSGQNITDILNKMT